MVKTPQKPPQELRDFQSLVQVVKALRDPVDGCPWDLEQTHRTLAKHMIEEAHELVDAIESKDRQNFIEELGDVLLQVILHAEIARQARDFDILDVIEGLNKKMISRHSHVFGDVEAQNASAALENWERMKAEEKSKRPSVASFEVPAGLPALQRASKIGGKTKKHNFDWPDIAGVLKKVDEEVQELKEAIQSGNMQATSDEIGDVLFTVAQVARHLDIDPESALRATNRRFESRFFKMKAAIEADSKTLASLPSDQIEAAWQIAKKSD